MNAYRCNRSRFSALVNDSNDKKNPLRYETASTIKTALYNLNFELLYMEEFDSIIVHPDCPSMVLSDTDKPKRKRPTEARHIGPSTCVPKPRPLTTNQEFAQKDKKFLWVCSILGQTPTARQASKFRRGIGFVWTNRGEAVRINRRRIAQTRADAAIQEWRKAMICEVALMDDQTQARADAERTTMRMEKHMAEMQAALNSI